MNKYETITRSLMEELQEITTQVSFDTWLKPISIFQMDDELKIAYLGVENTGIEIDFLLNVIRTRYIPVIEDCLQSVLHERYRVVVKDMNDYRTSEAPVSKSKDSAEPEPETEEPVTRLPQQNLNKEKIFNPRYNFENFVVGNSNKYAQAAALAVAESPSEAYNPLFIYGPSGLGKTHLVTAIKHEIIRRNPDKSVIYVTGEAFGNELIKAIDQRDTSVFHDKYRNADVLIVDDIQFFSGKERMQEEFFHTFNKLHSEDKQIVITSDKPPRDLKTLEERIRNRFEWGLIADISTPDFETRFAIIRRKAELLDLKIPDEVTEFIANRLKTNIRQLEGAVKKLKALKMLANSSPTISMAQSVIRDILTDDQPIPITVEKVIAEVANVYGITPEDIRSSKRTSQISTARKVAAYVVREVTGMPLAAIGMEFGGRDHSTIVYAINNVTTALKKDANLKELVDDIIKDIREKNPNPPTA